MVKLRLDKYSYSFIKHIAKFCVTHKLLQADSIVVAVSGGHDSMSLLHILVMLKRYQLISASIRVVSIDHGTRESINHEQGIIKKYCSSLGISYKKLSIKTLNLADGNFEMRARKLRYELLKEDIGITNKGELCLMAHHLDDCFEWSLMQSFKSSSTRSILGIPLKRSIFERPLLCVSRSQLENYSRRNKVPFVNDMSNLDLRYERNFIRAQIIPSIKKRYPKYLKHFVLRQQQLRKTFTKTSFSDIKILNRDWGLLLVTNGKIDLETLQDAIEKVSIKKRGTLQNQIDKFLTNFNSTNIKRGPYTFSGDVIVYNFNPLIIVKGRENLISLHTSQISDLVPFISKVLQKKDSLKQEISPFQKQTRELLNNKKLFNFSWRAAKSETLFYI